MLLAEECDRGGVAVQVAGIPNRADFAAAEKSRARNRSENFGERHGVVIGHAEEAMTAAVAGKDKGGKRLAAAHVVDPGQLDQVRMGRDFIPELILQSLSCPSPCADRYGPGLRIGAQQITDEKVAALQFRDVFGSSQPGEKISACPFFFIIREAIESLA